MAPLLRSLVGDVAGDTPTVTSHLPVMSRRSSESITEPLVGRVVIPESYGGQTMNARLMGRAAAGVGALVAAGAVTLVVVGGTANAAGTGRCTDNVNVREDPDITSQIVAVCERGQAVQVGKIRRRLRPADRPRRLGGTEVRLGGRPRARRRRRDVVVDDDAARRRPPLRPPLRRRGGRGGRPRRRAVDRRDGPRGRRGAASPTTSPRPRAGARPPCSADGGGGAGAPRARRRRRSAQLRAARPRRPTPVTRATPSTPSAARPRCRRPRGATRRCRPPRTRCPHRPR